MSILIIGYDGYSDLWPDCIELIKRFWPDLPYDVIFVNNEINVSFENVFVYHAGKEAEWSKKVQIGLSKCKTEYVCLFLEDFFIGKIVKTKDVEDLINLMENKRIDYIKLVDMNNAARDHNHSIKENKKIHKIRYSDDYGISLQPSIWNKQFLSCLVGLENYNAWKFEFDRVRESDPKNKHYRSNAFFDTRNILNIQHGVIQGEYIPKTIKYFQRKRISLNIKRKIMSPWKYRKLRMISFFKSLVPLSFRPYLKKKLENQGMEFVSTKRDK